MIIYFMSEVLNFDSSVITKKVGCTIMLSWQSQMQSLLSVPLLRLCNPAASNTTVKCSQSAVAFLSSRTKRGAKTICAPWPALCPQPHQLTTDPGR